MSKGSSKHSHPYLPSIFRGEITLVEENIKNGTITYKKKELEDYLENYFAPKEAWYLYKRKSEKAMFDMLMESRREK